MPVPSQKPSLSFIFDHIFFRYEESDSSESETEKSRKQDLQERDAFAARLKKKDKDKTRNVAEAQGIYSQGLAWTQSLTILFVYFMCNSYTPGNTYEEAAKRIKLEQGNLEKLVPHLRIESRRKYLEKRKDDKIAELEADIQDDEFLFEETVYVLDI